MVTRRALAQRIRLEIDELDKIVSVINRHWQHTKTASEDQDAFLNSVALNMHSFYNGLERILELIATEMDGGTLGGASWHTELLRQMTMEIPSVRPAVLTPAMGKQLDAYRKFRHRVRNIYTTYLDAAQMAHLVDSLPSTWQQISRELSDFIEFLDQLESSA